MKVAEDTGGGEETERERERKVATTAAGRQLWHEHESAEPQTSATTTAQPLSLCQAQLQSPPLPPSIGVFHHVLQMNLTFPMSRRVPLS